MIRLTCLDHSADDADSDAEQDVTDQHVQDHDALAQKMGRLVVDQA